MGTRTRGWFAKATIAVAAAGALLGGLAWSSLAAPAAAGASGTAVAAPEARGPLTKSEVHRVVARFMRARLDQSGAERFLTPNAADQYAIHDGGLYLYDGDVAGGEPEVAYAGFTILSLEQADANSWVARVRVDTGSFEGAAMSFIEELGVGPGTNAAGHHRRAAIRFAVRAAS